MGPAGFEPATTCPPGTYHTKLDHDPLCEKRRMKLLNRRIDLYNYEDL